MWLPGCWHSLARTLFSFVYLVYALNCSKQMGFFTWTLHTKSLSLFSLSSSKLYMTKWRMTTDLYRETCAHVYCSYSTQIGLDRISFSLFLWCRAVEQNFSCCFFWFQETLNNLFSFSVRSYSKHSNYKHTATLFTRLHFHMLGERPAW